MSDDIRGLDDVLRFDWERVRADEVVVHWTVTERHLQPFGLVHGGIYCYVNESTASMGGQVFVGDEKVVVGVNNNTDFIGQAGPGDTLTSRATPVHQGRSSQLWLIETRGSAGALVARGHVRLTNLDRAAPKGTADAIRR